MTITATTTPIAERRLQQRFHDRSDRKRFENRLGNPYIACREIRIAEQIASFAPGRCVRILEVGCGEGNNLYYLHDQLPDSELIGIDFAHPKVAARHDWTIPVRVPSASAGKSTRQSAPGDGASLGRFPRRLRSRLGLSGYTSTSVTALPRSGDTALTDSSHHMHGVCADATSLPFADNSFDVVLLRDLLHHVNWARDEVLAETMRVLHDHGRAIVIESNPDTLLNRLFRLLVPAERGMKDSRLDTLSALAGRYGQYQHTGLEPSQLVRAIGFVIGWPARTPLRALAGVLYRAAQAWECLIGRILPARHWAYRMIVVSKQAGR